MFTILLLTLLGQYASGVEEDPIPWDFYHTTSEILDDLQSAAIQFPNFIRYEEIQDQETEVKIPLIRMTDFGKENENRLTILMTFGEHGRELISSELAYWFVHICIQTMYGELYKNQVSQILAEKTQRSEDLDKRLKWILERVEFKIFPIVNQKVRVLVEQGDKCRREYENGVDPNRNWLHQWRQFPPENKDYGGKKAMSEPQTRIIDQISRQSQNLMVFVSVHSGEWALYLPWDSHSTLAENLPSDTLDIIEKMNIFCECMSGAGGNVSGYLAYGTAMDHMYAEVNVSYPITVEIFGPKGLGQLAHGGHPRRRDLLENGLGFLTKKRSLFAGKKDCFGKYNPVNKIQYDDVIVRWVSAFLVLSEHVAEQFQSHSISELRFGNFISSFILIFFCVIMIGILVNFIHPRRRKTLRKKDVYV